MSSDPLSGLSRVLTATMGCVPGDIDAQKVEREPAAPERLALRCASLAVVCDPQAAQPKPHFAANFLASSQAASWQSFAVEVICL